MKSKCNYCGKLVRVMQSSNPACSPWLATHNTTTTVGKKAKRVRCAGSCTTVYPTTEAKKHEHDA